LQSGFASHPGPVAAYRDEVPLSHDLWLGGEFATDGSLQLKERFQHGSFSIAAFQRATKSAPGDGTGAFFSYSFPRGMSLYGGFSHTRGRSLQEDWQNLAVRIPLHAGMDLTLERSRSATATGRNSANALMVTMPLGPLRLLTR